MAEMPIVIRERCTGCGLCISVCSCGAFVLENNVVAVVEIENCHWCGQCELVCPTGAITCPLEIVFEEQ